MIRIIVGAVACVLVAGGVFAWWLASQPSLPTLATVRSLLASRQLEPALHAVAQISQLDTPDAGVTLDEIYTGLCDAGSDEPDLLVSNPDIRRIARRLLEATSTRSSNSAKDYMRVGEFALAAGLYSDAVAALERARDANPGLQDVMTPLALALLGSDRLDELLNVVRAEDGATPHQRAALWMIRGRAQERLRQFDEARLSMHAALGEDPTNPGVMSRLGMMELAHGNPRDAETLLDRSRSIAPDAIPTLRLAAEHEFATGNYSASADLYRKLMEHTNAEIYDPIPASLGRARALIYLGDSRAAEEALNAAGAILGGDPHVKYYLALLMYRKGDYRRAVELAEPLDTQLKDLPELNLLIGAASLADGYVETAAHRLRRYLESEPSNAAAKALLSTAEAEIVTPRHEVVPRAELLAAFNFPNS